MSPKEEEKTLSTLSLYLNHISRSKVLFPCPLCGQSYSSGKFEKHCTYHHNINATLSCVWCEGRYAWPKGEKHLKCIHLDSCWRKFIEPFLSSPPSPALPTTPVAARMAPIGRKQHLLMENFLSPDRGLDPIWPADHPPPRLTYQDDSLNSAVACLHAFRDLGSEFFHVSIRHALFSSFLQVMDEDEGRTRTLPFSCWCNGGDERLEPRFRLHRHLIVVAPRGHFKRLMSRVRVLERPRANFKMWHSEQIVVPMHLINTMGYLAQHDSQCQSRQAGNKNHLYVFESLPLEYRLILALQYDNGCLDFLDQKFKNMKIGEMARSNVKRIGSKYRYRIKDMPDMPLGIVLPVSKHFQPCTHETPYFVHLIGGRKFYFEINWQLCHLSEEQWLQRQAEGGNLFLWAVGEEYWTPRPHYQALLNEFKPVVDENRLLRAQVKDLETLKRKLETEKQELESRIRDESRGRSAAETERDELRGKNQQLEAELERERKIPRVSVVNNTYIR